MSNFICLITGATKGLGRELATAFWHKGWDLILVARAQQALDDVVRELGPRPGQTAHSIAADLAKLDATETVFSAAQKYTRKLDALINNAAIQGAIGPLWENDWAEWQKTIQVDLLSPVALCRAFAPMMIAAGRGAIVNLSGGGATGPRANFTAYATAKAGLVRFSETLAEELKPHGVRVNCIAPGAMQTAMLAEVVAKGAVQAGKREYDIAKKTVEEGGASLQRVAELCLFLASEVSEGITGKLISAVWDPWQSLPEHKDDLASSDIYTLRRIVPKDRGKDWGE